MAQDAKTIRNEVTGFAAYTFRCKNEQLTPNS